MFKVIVEKECGCFRKSGIENNKSFESKDDALVEALNLTKKMNQDFCQKHEFTVKEDNNNILIAVDERVKSGCCGGGHCS